MCSIDNIRLDTGLFKHVFQPNTCPFRTGNGTVSPLVAFCWRIKEPTSIAAAFQSQSHGDNFELGAQIGDCQYHWVVNEPIDCQFPSGSIDLFWRNTIVAYKVA